MEMLKRLRKNNSRIFISYSRQDKALAENICTFLRQERGLNVFMDTDLDVGDQWSTRLESFIKKSEVLLVLLTRSLNDKTGTFVEKEIAVANDEGLQILPIAFAPENQLENVFDKIPLLRKIQIEFPAEPLADSAECLSSFKKVWFGCEKQLIHPESFRSVFWQMCRYKFKGTIKNSRHSPSFVLMVFNTDKNRKKEATAIIDRIEANKSLGCLKIHRIDYSAVEDRFERDLAALDFCHGVLILDYGTTGDYSYFLHWAKKSASRIKPIVYFNPEKAAEGSGEGHRTKPEGFSQFLEISELEGLTKLLPIAVYRGNRAIKYQTLWSYVLWAVILITLAVSSVVGLKCCRTAGELQTLRRQNDELPVSNDLGTAYLDYRLRALAGDYAKDLRLYVVELVNGEKEKRIKGIYSTGGCEEFNFGYNDPSIIRAALDNPGFFFHWKRERFTVDSTMQKLGDVGCFRHNGPEMAVDEDNVVTLKKPGGAAKQVKVVFYQGLNDPENERKSLILTYALDNSRYGGNNILGLSLEYLSEEKNRSMERFFKSEELRMGLHNLLADIRNISKERERQTQELKTIAKDKYDLLRQEIRQSDSLLTKVSIWVKRADSDYVDFVEGRNRGKESVIGAAMDNPGFMICWKKERPASIYYNVGDSFIDYSDSVRWQGGSSVLDRPDSGKIVVDFDTKTITALSLKAIISYAEESDGQVLGVCFDYNGNDMMPPLSEETGWKIRKILSQARVIFANELAMMKE